MSARWCTAAVVLVLLLAGCTAAPRSVPAIAPAAETFTVHGTGVARPFDRYELQDLHTFAESSGTPFAKVLAGARGSAELDELAAALEARRGSGIVMTGHDPDRPGTAYMTFTHRPSSAVTAQLQALPLDTDVTFGLPLPHAELVRYSEALAGSLDRLPGVKFLSCGPNALGNAVEVRYAVTGEQPSPAVLAAAALTETEHWSRDGRLRVPVRFVLGRLSDRVSTADAAGG